MATDLIRFEAARQALAEARSIDEVKDVRDKAEALRLYVKQQGESLEMQNDIAEIKLRAERRAGQLIKEMRDNGELMTQRDNQHTRSSANGGSPKKTVGEIGLKYSQVSDWQSIAAMPEETFEQVIVETKTAGDELTSAGMLRAAKEHAQERKRAERESLKQDTVIEVDATYNLFHADLNWLHDEIPDNSIDMFFTDPPYHADKPYLFGELAKLAAAKLKDNSLLLTYSGQMHLPQVMADMSQYLDYWWIFSVRHTGGHLTIWNRHLWNDWKPVLVFSKKGQTPIAPEWVQDFIDGGGRDKTYHAWGQDANEATYWIEKLTDPGDVICDPFVGGGAIPVACFLTSRRWIGTDKDEQTILTARERLLKVLYDSPIS